MTHACKRLPVSSLLAAIVALTLLAALSAIAAQPALAQEEPSPDIAAAKTDSALSAHPIPPASVQYRVKAGKTLQGWKSAGLLAGTTSNKKLRSFEIRLDTAKGNGTIQYQIHGQKAGWKKAVGTAATASVGAKDYIDGVRIALAGEISKHYDVSYRVYLSKTGWIGWTKNGAIAGKVGKKKPVRAIQVKLEKKATPSASPSAGIVGVRYRVNLQGSGWTPFDANDKVVGKAKKRKRVKNLKIELDKGTFSGSIKYRAHLTSGKWTKWKANGKGVGTSKKINAVQVKLTGEIANTYDVVYRAYVSTVGWQRRMRNGETAGVAEQNLPIGALRVALVAKDQQSGWIKSGSNWAYYQNGKKLKSHWLTTSESPIDPTLKGKHIYWLDSKGKLAADRFVLPSSKRDAKAPFAAIATECGYISCGKLSSIHGVTLSDSKGKLYNGDGWLTTSAFDGKKQTYRLESAGTFALVKTGLFTVGANKYYGYEDGRGYIMRSATHWAGDAWYKANASGVLTNVDNQTSKHIERYVKWAVKIAKNNSHGYSQKNRWGPDYDCSSLVVSALRAAGFPESGALWTGNMKKCLTSIGFVWHTDLSNLKRGDIMLVHTKKRQHTEIYIGGGKLVGAHSSETGGIDGKTGDQTGNEISVVKYYNAPWKGYLRYRS